MFFFCRLETFFIFRKNIFRLEAQLGNCFFFFGSEEAIVQPPTTLDYTLVVACEGESTFEYILEIVNHQKQPSRGVLWKRCSGNMQQIYRRTPVLKCDLNKVSLQLYWNFTSASVFSCKFAAYFRNTFS